MADNQSRAQSLREIQRSTFDLLTRLKGADAEQAQTILQEYLTLVDRFRQVSAHLAPHQYKAAKEDAEYFLRLLDLAIQYEAKGDHNEPSLRPPVSKKSKPDCLKNQNRTLP